MFLTHRAKNQRTGCQTMISQQKQLSVTMAPVVIKRMRNDEKFCYAGLVALPLACLVNPLPVSLHMILTTLFVIYIGCHQAIKFGTKAEKKEQSDGMETMKTKDAMMFPFIGSAVLFGLYLVFKYLPEDYKPYLFMIIKAYFFVFGILVTANKLRSIFATTLPVGLVSMMEAAQVTLPVPSWFQGDDMKPTCDLTLVDLLGLLVGGAVGVWYVQTNHWIASNIFGICFSLQGIEMLNLGSFFNGFILLSGLFFYDIFWVFGTEVMVSVAKSFDAPVKLLFPRGLNEEGVQLPNSMLGLGDVVIPGIFIALMLRLDCHLAHVRLQEKKGQDAHLAGYTFPRPYFLWNLFAYFLGLMCTVAVMYAFKAAQPALLYLVPACVGAALLTALARGEFQELWHFNCDETEEEEVAVPANKDKEGKTSEDAEGKRVTRSSSTKKKAN